MSEHERTIRLSRLGLAEERIAALAKRARRLGLEEPTLTAGEPFPDPDARAPADLDRFQHAAWTAPLVVAVTVTGPDVLLAGWVVLAVVDHLPAEDGGLSNVTRTLPGQELPEGLDADALKPDCDHCGHDRRRARTFLLSHETQGTKQVGSTCLQDFAGLNRSPESALLFLADLDRVTEFDDEDGQGGGGGSSYFGLQDLLVWTAASIRTDGWLSRVKARDMYPPGRATADWALEFMFPGLKTERPEATTGDRWQAARGLVWARRITDEQAAGSDYLRNCRAVARAGYIGAKQVGIAASIVSSYQRSVSRLQERRERALLSDVLVAGATSGDAGQRAEFRVRLLANPLPRESEWGCSWLHRWADLETGALLIWWGTNGAAGKLEDLGADVAGWEGTIRGTVKRHGDYQGEAQTQLARVMVPKPKTKRKRRRTA